MKQLAARQSEFTKFSSINIQCATWNVNAKKVSVDAANGPPLSFAARRADLIPRSSQLDFAGSPDPMGPWLFPDSDAGAGHPDIVAVGFQEIVDLNAVNVAVDSKAAQRSAVWQDQIHKTLNARTPYVLVAEVHLVGMLLCVFALDKHKASVSRVHTATVGVGVMGMMGNKGGVCVRMQIYDSTVCFVCSHLAAHRENVDGRNADFASIVAKTSFEIGKEVRTQPRTPKASVRRW